MLHRRVANDREEKLRWRHDTFYGYLWLLDAELSGVIMESMLNIKDG